MPQIEVTFDIDANGIVNVSAKDMGTGKEQSIKIESATSLSEDEIQEKIAEAEKFAEDDQRRKAKVELRNMADQVVYQTRRTLEESAEKLDDSDADPVKEHLDELEKMVQDEDGKPIDIDAMDDAAIQSKVKEIEEAMHAVSTKLYEAAAAEMAQQESGEDGDISVDDGVVDADFEVVEDEGLKPNQSRKRLAYGEEVGGRRMSEVPILKETTRTTGREALRNNITAAMALAGAVRTTLGPLGQDKLLIDDEGRTMVTNDGVTVLESAKVEHPVARMLINASTTQDRIARDGTTSAVLLSAEPAPERMGIGAPRRPPVGHCEGISPR